MRKIKFRAWFRPTQKHKAWFANRYGDELPDLWVGYYTSDEFLDDTWVDTDDYKQPIIFEQYTGLKDKNGEEIYEGDIVRYGDQVLGVKFDEMKDSDCSYYYLGWAMGDLSLCEHNTMVEVIGNIHENPELLGGEE